MQIPRPLRHATRRLLRAPLFTLTAVLTLAVGIGANTAIFSVVNGVLLKPLPYPEPDRLVSIWHTAPGMGFNEVNQSPATYLTYRSDSKLLEDIALWDRDSDSVTGLDRPEQVNTLMVTDGFLPLLGVRPVLGRVFTKEDDSPGTPETVMLSYGYWQRAFGGARDVVGRTLTMDGRPREIIGVLPRDFQFEGYDPAVLYPARLDPSKVVMADFSYQAFARMKPGVTLDQVAAEVNRLIPVAATRYPGPITQTMLDQAKFAALIKPLKAEVVGNVGSLLWVLLATVGMVLLIACANVANLYLVRAEGRIREVAVRTALGARSRDVAGQFLGESILLGLLGGAIGVVLAWGGLGVLLKLVPSGNLPRLHEINLDPSVLFFTLVISVFAGLLFGLLPLLRHGRPDLVPSLKEGGRGSSAGRTRHHARNGLVVAQVALALVLLVGSGLMVRSFIALRNVDPGFRNPNRVLTFAVSMPSAVVPDLQRVALAHEQIQQALAAIPGVESVGAVSELPMSGGGTNDPVYVQDFPTEEGQLPPIRRMKWIMPGYFQTTGEKLVAGRAFTWSDVHTRAPVAMVTEDFAREYWGGPADAVGKYIAAGSTHPSTLRRIIGVIGTVHDDGVDQPAPPIVYWPMVMTDFWDEPLLVRRYMVYAVRATPAAMTGLLPRVQAAVWSVNPDLPLAGVRTMGELLDRSLARTSFTLIMLAIAAAVALLLGTIGIYGVISYTVSQRTREIGVRMALGAEQRDVGRMVVGEGMVPVGVGLVIGLGAAGGLTRFMRSLLHGIAPFDPATYAAVALLLAAVAALASWLPARRAARLDPASTLRAE
ncbi:MAG: ABC transporter permease [Gemmatimonadota bacterium]